MTRDLQPLVLIPGVQGRWEYMRPAVDALRRWFRVLTFSLDGDSIEDAVEQVRDVLDARRIHRAVVCGISFGGVAALRFAAEHPGRTRALVLASAPGPDWRLDGRHERYARHPWLFGPLFLIETPLRLRAEVKTALPSRADRWRLALSELATLVRAPVSFERTAGRALAMAQSDRRADCARVVAPTLVVSGEPGLDRVVPVEGTRALAERIGGATHVTLAGTGHLGSVTRPEKFASLVRTFVEGLQHAAA